MFAMEKYAVIKLGSKQFLVREGDVIELERQEKPLKVEVLLYSDGQKTVIGEPEIKDISVKAEVAEEKLGKKVRVARFKKKSRYERVRGHRQPMSVVKIEKIGDGKPVKEEKEIKEKVKTDKVSEKPVVKEKKITTKIVEAKKTTAGEKVRKTTPAKASTKKATDKKLKGNK
jgi:large subunit ribosomal protein L21